MKVSHLLSELCSTYFFSGASIKSCFFFYAITHLCWSIGPFVRRSRVICKRRETSFPMIPMMTKFDMDPGKLYDN